MYSSVAGYLSEPRSAESPITDVIKGTHEQSMKNQKTLMSNAVQNTQLIPSEPHSTPATTPLNF